MNASEISDTWSSSESVRREGEPSSSLSWLASSHPLSTLEEARAWRGLVLLTRLFGRARRLGREAWRGQLRGFLAGQCKVRGASRRLAAVAVYSPCRVNIYLRAQIRNTNAPLLLCVVLVARTELDKFFLPSSACGLFCFRSRILPCLREQRLQELWCYIVFRIRSRVTRRVRVRV